MRARLSGLVVGALIVGACGGGAPVHSIVPVPSSFERGSGTFVLDENTRIDGRGPTDIRAIECTLAPFARLHGSAIFQRGETQALCAVTLGGGRDEQLIEGLQETYYRKFYLHYNFPPFSTGETGFMRGPKRREIGHGALAERALIPVIPSFEDFPYTLRLVSEVLASNGSSSMGSVCSSSLSMMDAGVPIKAPVAGIAMGLIYKDGEYVTLTDILGVEDAFGDMDFKVAGTRDGITAIQLDIKVRMDFLGWAKITAAILIS